MSEYKPPIGRKEPMLPENLPDDFSGPAPDTEAYWKAVRKRWEIQKMIERALWLLLGFVIGALAMYTSFPK